MQPSEGQTNQQQSQQLHGVSSGIAAGGSLIKGIAAAEAGKYNAKVDRFNQKNALADNVGQQQQVRDAARLAMGEQIAAQGESGTTIGVGSNLDALHESAIAAQLDALELRRKGSIQKTDFDIKRFNDKATGMAAFTGSIAEAASQAASGGADYAAAGA